MIRLSVRSLLSKIRVKAVEWGRRVLAVVVGERLYLAWVFWRVRLFQMPFSKRFAHTHIVAGSGGGKTQLIQLMMLWDVLRAQRGLGGFCVIDSQGDLIRLLSRLKLFDPRRKGGLAERLILIDPEDIAFPPCLNLFDVGAKRLGGIRDPAARASAFNATVSLYEYIFGDQVQAELTFLQKNVFRFGAALLMTVPGATIETFLDLLKDKAPFGPYIERLDRIPRRFFTEEFDSPKYEGTRREIASRLWNVISNPTFAAMFTHASNKVDMFAAMNQGKIVLVNTSKRVLQDGAKMLGRFFIALILQAAFQRAAIPEDRRLPFFVYIDEAQDYLSDKVAEFLEQARKYRIGLIIAHQYLEQLGAVSIKLKAAVHNNTATKIVGRMDADNAKAMAAKIGRTTEEITGLRSVDRIWAGFFCRVGDATAPAFPLRVPLGIVNLRPRLSDEAFAALIAANRRRYCSRTLDALEPEVRPDREGPGRIASFDPALDEVAS